MANKRMMSSDMFSDDVFMELDDITRLVWIGLIVMSADDQGRLQDNEMLVKSQIFPMDNKPQARVKQSMDLLVEKGLLQRYQKDGKKLMQIVNWWKHQSPSWASPSNYPAPDDWTDREKYHKSGNNIVTRNWDKLGGYGELHSILHSQLHSERVSGLVGNEVKSEVKYEGEVEVNGEVGLTTAATLRESSLSPVASVYESEIGVLTATIADELKLAVSEYPDGWIIDALKEASRQNKRNWSYARAILKRWKAEGRENGKARTQGGADLDKYRALYEQTKAAG